MAYDMKPSPDIFSIWKDFHCSLIYTASRDTLRRRPEQEGDKGSMNKTGATNDFFTSGI